jgi:hypothetical protein
VSSFDEWVPRPKQPYEAGNLAALKHGAWSARKVEPIARAFIDAVLERRADLVAHPEAVFAWAQSEARALMLGEYVADVGVGSDAALRVLRYEAQFQKLASELRGRLGLDPKSEAELVTAQATAAHEVVDLDAIRARGRAALRAARNSHDASV